MKHTIAVLVENKPGVLARVAGLFRRRGFNIESLTVGTTERDDLSRMTIVVEGDDKVVEQVIKQLNKLIETIKVSEITESSVERELCLIRVHAPPEKRGEIVELTNIFRARIVDVSRDSFIIEVTGDEDKVSAFIDLMRQYGIKELARTGKVAMVRGNKK
ncbi:MULTISPECIES: acetolactate synthase small subunit [Archaeoglobus]|uniref:Probable acetolactate synthase small subunit n=3 Tax=Archaeoglobus fulgidus TaxID=2234 RepID=ILVH_ARCFU|nr:MULTISPECIES: acetolactate synthase small subunit [Archaeoglobus]O28555.1 RecName: Full=Probable acetolactate synthase small subunit; AltName: Full=Acetohydroxy-acid synthase small subunit; Short=AHAS; Short=ALS [Archaeoglobus fulgidus DSM 4304]AAB89532.1 acetolactate synthase, small subunit (ilvN) [Archaeoglobus fulgidus DSM 4304]AIG98720.1 acetolactate synthase, small subunit [Archaeoglobus fulgidus DSM 8774]KUJ93534.1 MAG: putative acetolactate synthase small subunit [Archaeoglobus fulgid